MMVRVLLVVGALMVAYGAFQTGRAANLRAEVERNEIELRACGARLTNLIEDIQSDAQAADLLDNLDAVPSHWLLSPAD